MKNKYNYIDKLCLFLYLECKKLKYLFSIEILVLCKISILKHLFNKLVLQGRIMKWTINCNVFALKYMPLGEVMSETLKDFITKNSYIKFQDSIVVSTLVIIVKPYGF